MHINLSMKINERVAKCIKDIRLSNHLTLTELAYALEEVPSEVELYEAGGTSIPVEYVWKLCLHFGVASDYFFEEE